MDVALNSHPAGATGTTLSGVSKPQMLGPPGVIATNVDTNVEAFNFGFDPVQSVKQRGLKFNLLDQAFGNAVETLTVQVPADNSRGTILFSLTWGDFKRGALKYLAAAHRDFVGDIIHEVRVIGNALYTGAIIVAWVPEDIPITSVADLQRYDYQILAANMQKNYVFVNHTSKIQQFYSTIEPDGTITPEQQVGKLVALVHTPIQPASESTSAYISLHVTERFATEADRAIGATPVELNYSRSDAELESILSSKGKLSYDNLLAPASSIRDAKAQIAVDSSSYVPITTKLTDIYSNAYSFNSKINKFSIPPVTLQENDDSTIKVQSVLGGATPSGQTSSYYSLLPGAACPSRATFTDQRTVNLDFNLGTIICSRYVIYPLIGDFTDEFLQNGRFSDIDEVESYMITNQNCVFAATGILSYRANAHQTFSNMSAGSSATQQLEVLVDTDVNQILVPGQLFLQSSTGNPHPDLTSKLRRYQFDYELDIVASTIGIRDDGTTVCFLYLDMESPTYTKFTSLKSEESNPRTYDLDNDWTIKQDTVDYYTQDGGKIATNRVQSETPLSKIVKLPSIIDIGKLDVYNHLVISSTISTSVKQNPLNLKQIRFIPGNSPISSVQPSVLKTNALTLPSSYDEVISNNMFASQWLTRKLIRLGSKSGTVTMELIWEPETKVFFANAPEFSVMNLPEENLYILSVENASTSTIPKKYGGAWLPRVVNSTVKYGFSDIPELRSVRKLNVGLSKNRRIISNPTCNAVPESALAFALGGGIASGLGHGLMMHSQHQFIDEQLSKSREFQRDFALETMLKENEYTLARMREAAILRGLTTKSQLRNTADFNPGQASSSSSSTMSSSGRYNQPFVYPNGSDSDNYLRDLDSNKMYSGRVITPQTYKPSSNLDPPLSGINSSTQVGRLSVGTQINQGDDISKSVNSVPVDRKILQANRLTPTSNINNRRSEIDSPPMKRKKGDIDNQNENKVFQNPNIRNDFMKSSKLPYENDVRMTPVPPLSENAADSRSLYTIPEEDQETINPPPSKRQRDGNDIASINMYNVKDDNIRSEEMSNPEAYSGINTKPVGTGPYGSNYVSLP